MESDLKLFLFSFCSNVVLVLCFDHMVMIFIMIAQASRVMGWILFYLISFIILQGTKKKHFQNETDINNANMFKWYNDYTRHNYTN